MLTEINGAISQNSVNIGYEKHNEDNMANLNNVPIPVCTECGSDEFVEVLLSEEEQAEGLSYTICSECGTSYFLKVLPRERAEISLQNINRLRRHIDQLPLELWRRRISDVNLN